MTQDLYGYDEMPYPSAPYPYSHPDHLATIAKLFGLHASDPASARVLEVGCADGANLIPMAATLPDGQFVGIDLSARQIASGVQAIDDLQLTNVRLLQQNLDDWKTNETFDFIIAHGFYSWTPRETRDQLLTFCRQRLTPRGIAFVSYNVLPGWQDRLAIRHWLQAELAGDESKESIRMERVRDLLTRLEKTLQSSRSPRDEELVREVGQLLRWSPEYLRHDLLEDFNQPASVSEFFDHVESHGLKFFAEADLATMVGADLPQEFVRGFASLASTVRAREQMIDLMTRRPFRQSLLCRAEDRPAGQLQPAAVESMFVVSLLRPLDPCTLAELPSRMEQGGGIVFAAKSGFRLTVRNAVHAAALLELAEMWPMGERVATLLERSFRAWSTVARSNDSVDVEGFCALVLAVFLERTVELHTIRPLLEPRAGVRPCTTELVQWQVKCQEWVTNLRHDVVPLDESLKRLLPCLTGKSDRGAILGQLQQMDVELNGELLEKQLVRCARLGLLRSEPAR